MTDQIDTGTLDLLATLNEGVLTLTLNRPEARNAMSEAMNRALAEQLAWAEVAPSVKCVVLTGAGKGFCAGGDVKGMAERTNATTPITPDEAIYRQRVNQRATAGRLFKMPKPTLAALPGAAAGAGLAWALACDLRIMSRTAILTTAFARVGFSGDYGGTYFLTQLVGSARPVNFTTYRSAWARRRRCALGSPTGSANRKSLWPAPKKLRADWRGVRASPIVI
jgi:2-(1,2-epoxy-1,2-dihydrophenyl)acetyl-CoA isomerase